jgi:hypothetical protein
MKRPKKINQKQKEETIQNIKQLLKRYPKVKWEDIGLVGLVESGGLQYNVPTTILNLKVITLLAYLKWYFRIGDKLE